MHSGSWYDSVMVRLGIMLALSVVPLQIASCQIASRARPDSVNEDTIRAQLRRGRVELGIDASVVRNGGDPSWSVDLPVALLRVGVFLSDRLAVEPSVAAHYERVDGASMRSLAADMSALVFFRARNEQTRVFLRPTLGFRTLRLTSSASDAGVGFSDGATEFVAGVGLGLRIGIRGGFSIRPELSFRQGITGTQQSNAGLVLGLSYLAH